MESNELTWKDILVTLQQKSEQELAEKACVFDRLWKDFYTIENLQNNQGDPWEDKMSFSVYTGRTE